MNKQHNAVIQQKITDELDKIDKLKKLILQSRREVLRLQGELIINKGENVKDFNKELSDLLSRHNVAIIARGKDGWDAEIGFQSNLTENHWTGRHHLTAHEINFLHFGEAK
tara:strand:- start:1844 stop:2176 length:333 start_codon:yes stop_codon:yes gene_type:complete